MNIGIVGAAGRMGQMLLAAVMATPGARIVGGVDRADHPEQGEDLGTLAGAAPTGLPLGSDLDALVIASDVVVDFSTPATLLLVAPLVARHGKGYVVGTTGLGIPQHEALATAAQMVPVVQAANMSIGVNLLLGLVGQAAATLGPEYDIEIVEMHHRHKVDAPSGTALALGEVAAAARGVSLDAMAVRSRDGEVGARPQGAIGFATLRGGDVVGDHTVIFAGDGERLELTHKASSRAVFVRGAVRAAMWTKGRAPGLYGMRHVLGFV